MERKLNIISMIVGLFLVFISIYIRYTNNFKGSKGVVLLMIGTVLTIVGVVFTPKIWEPIANIIDILVMFFLLNLKA